MAGSGDEGERRRAAFLVALRAGRSVGEACALVGWGRKAYEYHRRRYRDWAVECSAVLASGRRGLGPVGDVPAGFAEFAVWAFGVEHHAAQLRIAEAVAETRPGEVTLVLTWRKAGKTTALEHYMCRRLALDRSHRFAVLSQSDGHASRMIQRVQRLLTDARRYPEFLARFGPFWERGQERRGFPWSTHELRVAGREDDERDPSIVARAISSAAHGSRIDTLLVDDVVAPVNVSSSQRILELLQGTFFSSELGMRIVVVGNRLERGDLYERMLDAGLVSRLLVIPAAGGFGRPADEPTVPEAWQREIDQHRMVHRSKLRDDERPSCCPAGLRRCPRDDSPLTPREAMENVRHRVGEKVWWALYQQQPQANELSTFAGLLDGCLDRDRVVGPVPAVV